MKKASLGGKGKKTSKASRISLESKNIVNQNTNYPAQDSNNPPSPFKTTEHSHSLPKSDNQKSQPIKAIFPDATVCQSEFMSSTQVFSNILPNQPDLSEELPDIDKEILSQSKIYSESLEESLPNIEPTNNFHLTLYNNSSQYQDLPDIDTALSNLPDIDSALSNLPDIDSALSNPPSFSINNNDLAPTEDLLPDIGYPPSSNTQPDDDLPDISASQSVFILPIQPKIPKDFLKKVSYIKPIANIDIQPAISDSQVGDKDLPDISSCSTSNPASIKLPQEYSNEEDLPFIPSIPQNPIITEEKQENELSQKSLIGSIYKSWEKSITEKIKEGEKLPSTKIKTKKTIKIQLPISMKCTYCENDRYESDFFPMYYGAEKELICKMCWNINTLTAESEKIEIKNKCSACEEWKHRYFGEQVCPKNCVVCQDCQYSYMFNCKIRGRKEELCAYCDKKLVKKNGPWPVMAA